MHRTNAIKFTKDQPERKITVTLGSSSSRPPTVWKEVNFTTDEGSNTDHLDKTEWGKAEKVYIWLKVTDTGMSCVGMEVSSLY
jgi:signal transduction histidine kinase